MFVKESTKPILLPIVYHNCRIMKHGRENLGGLLTNSLHKNAASYSGSGVDNGMKALICGKQ